MQELTLLHTKLDSLLKKYTTLQQENLRLTNELGKKNEELNKLEGKVTTLKEKLATEGTVNALADKDGKQIVKQQLNVLIKDIDKLLASLND